MLTHILKYSVSFHVWKLVAGFVLSVLTTIFLFLLFTESLREQPLSYTMIAMTVTLCIGAVMLLQQSVLPYGGSVFLWPFVSQKPRNDWRIARHPLKLLDVIFMLSATTTVVAHLLDMLPRASHWQGTAFVISMSVMFMMTVIIYGTRFLPDKLWIDKVVAISGGVIALIACITLGLQPM